MKKEWRNKEGNEKIWGRNEGISKKKERYEEGVKEYGRKRIDMKKERKKERKKDSINSTTFLFVLNKLILKNRETIWLKLTHGRHKR